MSDVPELVKDQPAPDGAKFNLLFEELLKDRKAERKSKLIRTFLIVSPFLLGVVFLLLGLSSGKSVTPAENHVALVRISGEIMPDSKTSAEAVNPALVEAFNDKEATGVVLLINSPGGTPVQASLIHDRIASLKKEFPDKKVIAVGEDMVTSGAYMIAVGADKIVVNRSTVTGSIGVISRNFGFQGTMEKLGVERRTLTSGESKNRLDPFGPFTAEDQKKMTDVLSQIHTHFKDIVLESRQAKLGPDAGSLFTGDFWTGEQAVKLGLADEISDLSTVLRKDFGVKRFKDYTKKDSFMDQLGKNFMSLSMDKLGLVQAGPQVLAMPQ